jgi:hypothetical protein
MGISARGGLEPHFRVLFSAIFQGFPWGISIRVETCGSERKQKCGLLWRFYIQSFYMYWCFTFPREYQKSQFNALLSTHHSFASPIPPGLLWGRQTLPRRLQIDYPLSAGRFASLRFRPKNMAHHISQLESEHCR